MWNTLEMSDGTKYRVLVELDELIRIVDGALKTGGLITVPMGRQQPGTMRIINPAHVIAVSDHMASI